MLVSTLAADSERPEAFGREPQKNQTGTTEKKLNKNRKVEKKIGNLEITLTHLLHSVIISVS